MTRQRAYQIRHVVAGLCALCPRAAVRWHLCESHLRKARRQNRDWRRAERAEVKALREVELVARVMRGTEDTVCGHPCASDSSCALCKLRDALAKLDAARAGKETQ